MTGAETTPEQTTKRQHPLSHQAKAVNLNAVQTINGLIDVLEDLIGRCTPPSYSGHTKKSAGSLPELKARYEIEFILPTANSNNNMMGQPIKRKHRDKEALSLRSITVAFPEQLRKNVRKWALTSFPTNRNEPHPQEEESFHIAMRLRDHALGELLRLLTIAGMQAPASSVKDMQPSQHQGQHHKEATQFTLSDHFLQELGIDPMDESITAPPTPSKPQGQSLAFFGRTQAQPQRPTGGKAAPPTYSHPHMQAQRQAFMNSIPWNKFAQDYDQAFLDAQADWTTERLELFNVNTLEGRERREKFVSQICGGVRIWRAPVDDEEEADELDDIPEGLDVVAQLIAIRRLNLLLSDKFDYLRMEKMGRMWEQLTIVLTPPRNRGPSSTQIQKDNGTTPFSRQGKRKKLNKWERRLKRRDKNKAVSRGRMRHVAETFLGPKKEDLKEEEDEDSAEESQNKTLLLSESGFKFSYGTQSDQGMGQVTAYIPIDFRDGELVRQLYTHLYDYFDMCCGQVGFLKYGADGEISATVDVGEEEDASRSRSGSREDASEERSGGQNGKKMGMEE